MDDHQAWNIIWIDILFIEMSVFVDMYVRHESAPDFPSSQGALLTLPDLMLLTCFLAQ